MNIQLMKNKRGSLLEVGKGFAMFILTIGVVLSVAGIVLNALRNSQTAGTAGFAGAEGGANATGLIAAQLPTVGTIIGVALIVAVVFGSILVYINKKKGDGGF